MADIQYYERVIKAQEGGKRFLPRAVAICGYIFILTLWLVIAVRVGISASLLMLIPLSVLTAVWLTWKYTSIEYEYSFTAGIFTFSKIYGKTKRKTVFEADLKTLVSAVPYDERAVETSNARSVINAIVTESCPNPCVCIFEENDKRTCVILDCDEMSARILRFFKPSATDRRIFEHTKKQNTEVSDA